MAELTTLARPYARAVFAVATAEAALDRWSRALAVVAAVSSLRTVRPLLFNPAKSAGQVADILIGICSEELDDKARNLVHLLAENRRLQLLPEISALFEKLKALQQMSADVEISTAFEISPATSRLLAEALQSRLQREIRLTTRVDAGLIGGAVIRAGDSVIDGSVRGKLTRLTDSLHA